jgi:hypothetical protein
MTYGMQGSGGLFRMKPLTLCLLLLLLGGRAAWAGDKVEAALYLGLNNPPSTFSHVANQDLTDRLRTVFGFRHYVLIKRDKIELAHTWTQWFVPRRDFFICVKPLAPMPDEPRLVDYEIYQEGFIVAKGKYEPNEGTPLFINGPDFKNGRLIFVLENR